MEELVMVYNDTFRDKKVFLTGHTGFKGRMAVANAP